MIYDEYRQRPLTVKVGPGWAMQMAVVKVYRESWVEAPMRDEHSRAWIGLVSMKLSTHSQGKSRSIDAASCPR